MEKAIVRAKAYSEAGADCIYPMGPGDIETLNELRDRINAPINIRYIQCNTTFYPPGNRYQSS